MTTALLSFVSISLFMIHEFEEIIFVRQWIKKGKNNPKLRQDIWLSGSSHYPSTPVIALMIAEEFIVASIILFIAIIFTIPELVLAVLIAHTLHLIVGHILPALIIRRWTPGSVTAVATLPFIATVMAITYATTNISWVLLLLLTIVVTVVLVSNLRILYAKSVAIGRWVESRY